MPEEVVADVHHRLDGGFDPSGKKSEGSSFSFIIYIERKDESLYTMDEEDEKDSPNIYGLRPS